jgi:hypothetical protein
MLKQGYYRLALCLTMIAVLGFAAQAQEVKTAQAALSVVGVKLGNRASAKAFLGDFQARQDEIGRPIFYFYNKFANQVMKLTGASFEDKYFITEIEVYKVNKSYTAPHFQAEKIAYFKTDRDIFIGYKQSTASMITGIPNIDGKDMTGPKTVIKKMGAPTEDLKTDEKETLVYSLPNIEIANENSVGKVNKFNYFAQYEFTEGKLKKYTLKISALQL